MVKVNDSKKENRRWKRGLKKCILVNLSIFLRHRYNTLHINVCNFVIFVGCTVDKFKDIYFAIVNKSIGSISVKYRIMSHCACVATFYLYMYWAVCPWFLDIELLWIIYLRKHFFCCLILIVVLQVLGYGVGVIGTSKGGDLAVSMAAFIPSVIACVTINGFFAPCNQGIRVEGHLYPPFEWDQDRLMITDDGTINVKACIPGHKHLEQHMLPLEKSHSAFLFLVSIDDQNVNSEFQAQGARKYLSSHNYKHDCLVESYPGTGHLLEPPYSPHCYASFQHTFMSAICWGGSCKYHTLGQERAWEKMQNFLWYHLVERVHISNRKYVTSVPLRSHL